LKELLLDSGLFFLKKKNIKILIYYQKFRPSSELPCLLHRNLKIQPLTSNYLNVFKIILKKLIAQQ